MLDVYYKEETQKHPKFEEVINSKVLLKDTIDAFKGHKSREVRKSVLEDKTLCGYLGLIERLVKNCEN